MVSFPLNDETLVSVLEEVLAVNVADIGIRLGRSFAIAVACEREEWFSMSQSYEVLSDL